MVSNADIQNVRKGLETALYHVLIQTLQAVPHGVDRDALLAHLQGKDEITTRGEALPHAGALAFMKLRAFTRALDVLTAHDIVEVTTSDDGSLWVEPTSGLLDHEHTRVPDGFLDMLHGHRDLPLRDDEQDLFESLRQLRLTIAREEDVPAYVIAHDRTLKELARRRPTTPESMRAVHGIGPKFMEEYGGRFLARFAAGGSFSSER